MTATDRLIRRNPELVRHNEGHWDKPYDPDMPGYSSFNDAGIECEVGEFLHGLIRILKPARVLETGTHWGIGAAYMGLALADNGHGKLDTLEFLPEIHTRAVDNLMKLGLHAANGGPVETFLADAGTFKPIKPYQVIFLDTEPQTRFSELIQFHGYLTPGGFIFIHDLHRHMQQIDNPEHGYAWPFGKLPGIIWQRVMQGDLRPFHFQTPRGLTGFYKPHPDDYIWK